MDASTGVGTGVGAHATKAMAYTFDAGLSALLAATHLAGDGGAGIGVVDNDDPMSTDDDDGAAANTNASSIDGDGGSNGGGGSPELDVVETFTVDELKKLQFFGDKKVRSFLVGGTYQFYKKKCILVRKQLVFEFEVPPQNASIECAPFAIAEASLLPTGEGECASLAQAKSIRLDTERCVFHSIDVDAVSNPASVGVTFATNLSTAMHAHVVAVEHASSAPGVLGVGVAGSLGGIDGLPVVVEVPRDGLTFDAGTEYESDKRTAIGFVRPRYYARHTTCSVYSNMTPERLMHGTFQLGSDGAGSRHSLVPMNLSLGVFLVQNVGEFGCALRSCPETQKYVLRCPTSVAQRAAAELARRHAGSIPWSAPSALKFALRFVEPPSMEDVGKIVRVRISLWYTLAPRGDAISQSDVWAWGEDVTKVDGE